MYNLRVCLNINVIYILGKKRVKGECNYVNKDQDYNPILKSTIESITFHRSYNTYLYIIVGTMHDTLPLGIHACMPFYDNALTYARW